MKITLEGSPKELKEFLSPNVDARKLWTLINKKDQGHSMLTLITKINQKYS